MPSARSSVRRRLLVSAGLSCVMAMAAADAVVPPDTNASGVFLNEAGDVLTARHAVSDCRTLFAVKGAQVSQATVIAASPALDLAVLRTTLKPYLSATLSRADAAPGRSVGVFAEAYAVLQRLPDRAGLLSNAMTVPGAEGLQLLSGVQPGASGSAVLGADGLLLGVVVERVAAAPHASGMTTLSRAASAAGVKGGATQVRAVPASQVRQFLGSHGIAFTESDSPQLSPMQSPAARASTLSVGVLCG
ncbi:serine protease [Variovorax sp. EL159]|uniref:S1 family peptidase n=1 Tax=unclassified Variovorax TaxID=663243 RepID=UPI0008823EBA|nr:serine protease [Variovorax sp. EL159]SCX46703.1 Trypsin-like peptidase domain-containing protein [Variovorax sp. EL159]